MYWFGDKGILNAQALVQDLTLLEEEVTLLNAQHELNTLRLDHIKSDQDGIDALIREQLGWVKQGEQFYRLTPSHE